MRTLTDVTTCRFLFLFFEGEMINLCKSPSRISKAVNAQTRFIPTLLSDGWGEVEVSCVLPGLVPENLPVEVMGT